MGRACCGVVSRFSMNQLEHMTATHSLRVAHHQDHGRKGKGQQVMLERLAWCQLCKSLQMARVRQHQHPWVSDTQIEAWHPWSCARCLCSAPKTTNSVQGSSTHSTQCAQLPLFCSCSLLTSPNYVLLAWKPSIQGPNDGILVVPTRRIHHYGVGCRYT